MAAIKPNSTVDKPPMTGPGSREQEHRILARGPAGSRRWQLRQRDGSYRHRSCADLLKPASHRRLGRHRRDVRGGCRVFDPCWLDQARRWSCDDVARRPRTPPVRSPSFANPLKSELRRARQGGTEGSNPSPSSRQSVSRPHPRSKVDNPGFPRGCARPAWRPGRQRRAGCFDIAPTGGNISVGPYSSTAVPLMGSARMPRGSQRSWPFFELQRAVLIEFRIGLKQSQARSADRAR
jgi:hypothetical protein